MARLKQTDRNLATALVMGVLRWQIALDAMLAPLLARPGQPPLGDVMLALRLGAFQLRYLERVPAHAAVSESVELCRRAGQPQAAAMVNAVLRRLLREGEAERRGIPICETTEQFARRLGHPKWLVERWVKAYGWEAALRICEAGQREPARGGLFRGAANTRREEPVEAELHLAAADEGVAVGGGQPNARRVSPDADRDAEDAENGTAHVPEGGLLEMDDGSRLVAELAVVAMPTARRIWDCCAAPGGKTAVLLTRLAGAAMVASDASGRRLQMMQRRMNEAGLMDTRLRLLTSAAEALPDDEGAFDLVLCDVPCSGTGTLARNPEIRHRLRLEDVARHAARQRRILEAALRRVAPGGVLVYSTCSLEPEECDDVLDDVARGWVHLPIANLLGQLVAGGVVRGDWPIDSLSRGVDLRTLPGMHPCDGFFAALLRRPGS